MTKIKEISNLIRKRRAIFPPNYIQKPIPKEIIWEILENANWAPTHKMTEPWRFKVFTGGALSQLSEFMTNWYQENTPAEKFSERKLEKNRKKALQSACVIAICMQRDPKERLPEWEEIAAVACAVQNMWLTATAYGIGSYWSSPKSIHDAQDVLELKEDEHCLGFFYMGYHNLPELSGKRTPIADKVEWVTG